MARCIFCAVIFFWWGAAAGAEVMPFELRGEVSVELEPVFLLPLGIESPLDSTAARRWALEDSAAVFSGMIYGWAFAYEPGERARQIQEYLELTPLGKVESSDDALSGGTALERDSVLYLWCDYQLSAEQRFRISQWRASDTKELKAQGYSPLHGPTGTTDRTMIKQAALEDAIKKAIRAELRAQNGNRPRIVKGFIALSAFPIYRIFHGNWAAQASFRFRITEITPFAAY